MSENTNCNIDINELKTDLLKTFRSSNPLILYQNSKSIKDKFSLYISCVTNKIGNGFSIEDNSKGFIFQIYKNCDYHKIWIRELEIYLKDSRYFDMLSYLYFVKKLNNEKYCIMVGLQKLYKQEKDIYIEKFLKQNNSFFNLNYIKKIFEDYEISSFNFDFNLNINYIEHFIEKCYFQIEDSKKEKFLSIFTLKINKNEVDYEKAAAILQKVIDNYVTPDKLYKLNKTINNPDFDLIKNDVDKLIDNYLENRGNFYIEISKSISGISTVDRYSFWLYIKTKLVDKYYPEIKYLFYDYSSNQFLDKKTYTNLKGNITKKEIISPEAKYISKELDEIIELKDLIIELNNNIFSFILLPVVYALISDKLLVTKKDMYKLKYLLLYILSSDYLEYKNLYKFFNQLEIFLNYEDKYNIFEKLKVCFSIIWIGLLAVSFGYLYLPIGVFLGILLYFGIIYVQNFHPNFYFKQKWNVGFKFFSICLLVISTFFWFQNFDNVIQKKDEITNIAKNLGEIQTKDIVNKGFENIKASLFDLSN